MGHSLDLVTYSFQRGQFVLARRSAKQCKQSGQFLTPPTVARFMAQQLGPIQEGDRILDPAIGSGTLVCAIIERIVDEGQPVEVWIDGYETDKELCQTAKEVLERISEQVASRGITVHTRVYERDFILDCTPKISPKISSDNSGLPSAYSPYDHIIANPPYFKLNRKDPRVKAVADQVKGHTNIYTLFMALAVEMLSPTGRACFIVPRSFCSGAYFSAFRRDFIQRAVPLSIHLFESRQDTFKSASVLQENVILTFRQRQESEGAVPYPTHLSISTSRDASALDETLISRRISIEHFVKKGNGALFFRLPTGELDEQILETVDKWTGSLRQYGLEVSTGPVVPFRARSFLMNVEAVERGQAVPLLWMQNVRPHRLEWPVLNGNKPQGISLDKEAERLLVPAANCVLLRRFSAKEEPRRLIAAPLLADQYDYPWIGLENHLNYVYGKRRSLETEEALGLSALFNSALIDRYFRIVNGNTQVNATELRTLPLPPLELIKRIGREVSATDGGALSVDIDTVVFSTLREAGYLPPDFPIIRETRITMGKIQQAQEILKILGLPPAQQNEISALTLLVLAQLSEETPWGRARIRTLRIHDMLIEIKERYGREYAENTRETIRRQVIHQFIQAGLVVPNPDDPTRPTNSPKFCYALSDTAIRTIRAYQSDGWQQAIESFFKTQDALFEVYQRSQERHKVPIRLASGEEYHLSPGKHNELQAAVVEEFGPRFAPGAKLLYLGDTANKTLHIDEAGFEELGIPVPSHDKLPDIVFYDETHNWLFLIEAVTSHGPVSPKRHLELEEVFSGCSAGRVYVTAFPDFKTFKNHLTEIAWETEVWLAEMPDHMIHFNGDRFLGPRG